MQGYIAKQHHGPVRRYCRSLQLRDNPELIAAYRDRHAEGNIWPEVLEGFARWEYSRWRSTSTARNCS